jgi:hypothetical protein
MKTKRIKAVEKAIAECIETLNNARLSREELVVALGQLLIRSGYSVHWNLENPGTERPEKVDQTTANNLYHGNPTTGTTLMKIGFDLQEVLLLRK